MYLKHFIGIIFLIKKKQRIVIIDFLYAALPIIVSIIYLIHAIYGVEFIIKEMEYLGEIQKINPMIIFDIIMGFGLTFSMIKYNRSINNVLVRIYYNIIVSCVCLIIFVMMN
jgi:hypothetical protein